LLHDNYNALHRKWLFSRGDINTINGAVTLAFLTSVKGNRIIVGVEPFVLDTDIEVNENLAIPGVFNPCINCGYPVERITINNADCRNL